MKRSFIATLALSAMISTAAVTPTIALASGEAPIPEGSVEVTDTTTGTHTLHAGDTLTTTEGTWSSNTSPISSYAYQWERCEASGGAAANCRAEANGAGTSYTVQAADVGELVRVSVTATNASGTGRPNTSLAWRVFPPSSGETGTSSGNETGEGTHRARGPLNTSTPTIAYKTSRSPRRSVETLVATPGLWQDEAGKITRYEYEWLRCNRHGSNCVNSQDNPTNPALPTSRDTYELEAGEVANGDTIRVTVWAIDTSGNKSDETLAQAEELAHSSGGREAIVKPDISAPFHGEAGSFSCSSVKTPGAAALEAQLLHTGSVSAKIRCGQAAVMKLNGSLTGCLHTKPSPIAESGQLCETRGGVKTYALRGTPAGAPNSEAATVSARLISKTALAQLRHSLKSKYERTHLCLSIELTYSATSKSTHEQTSGTVGTYELWCARPKTRR